MGREMIVNVIVRNSDVRLSDFSFGSGSLLDTRALA